MTLLFEVEQEFGLQIPLESLEIDDFRSLTGIAQLLAKGDYRMSDQQKRPHHERDPADADRRTSTRWPSSIARVDNTDWRIPPAEVPAWLKRTLFEHPWFDPEIPSLVYIDDSGEIMGFIGSHVRRMRFDGEPVRIAVDRTARRPPPRPRPRRRERCCAAATSPARRT